MELRGTRLSSWSAELTLRTTSVEMPSVSPTREAHLRGKCLRYTRGSWIWHHANLDARTSAPFAPLPLGQGAMRLVWTVPRVFLAVVKTGRSGNFAPEFVCFAGRNQEIRPRQFIKCFKNLGKIQKNARHDQAETTARERGRSHVTVQTMTGGGSFPEAGERSENSVRKKESVSNY